MYPFVLHRVAYYTCFSLTFLQLRGHLGHTSILAYIEMPHSSLLSFTFLFQNNYRLTGCYKNSTERFPCIYHPASPTNLSSVTVVYYQYQKTHCHNRIRLQCLFFLMPARYFIAWMYHSIPLCGHTT